MKRYLIGTLFISTCGLSLQALALDLNQVSDTLNAAAETAQAAQNAKDSLDGKNDQFSSKDRSEYQKYFQQEKTKQKNLPKGLEKKVASGKNLPPGWQNKVAAGEVFPEDLRRAAIRSPYPSPKGTSTYILENKVVRVLDATNVILDVLTN